MHIDDAMPVNQTENPGSPAFESRFDLSDLEISQIEAGVCDQARDAFGNTVSVAWISAGHPYSNFARTHEARIWSEAGDVDPLYDLNQDYLVIVDTREDDGVIAHAASIMWPRERPESDQDPQITGVYTIDSLISRGNFSLADFYDFYDEHGVNMRESIAVETNFKLDPDFEPFNGLGTAELTYLTVVNTVIGNGSKVGSTVAFATINESQINSFERVGVSVQNLMGRDEFSTEEGELGIVSKPVAIELTQETHDLFQGMALILPSIKY
ncbi:MAG: hypothetical protein NTX11_04575 [Candidatus Saccharibacteria bacterium]|nr:hypothetical protein [Candidatus Saccharibacteria bacterium]